MQKKRQRQRLLSWTIFAVMIVCGWTSSAAQDARVIETLPDGSYIVEVAGERLRTVTGDKAILLAQQKIQLQECRENEARNVQIVELLKKDVTIAEQKADIEHRAFINAMQMYTAERELRTEAMQMGAVTGTPKGFGGWLLRAVNSPYGSVAFRLVLPTAQAIKVFTTK